MTIFAELSPAHRVQAVDQTVSELLKSHAEELATGPFSEPTKTWVERMKLALVDDEVSEQSLREILEPFAAYRDRLDEDERKDVNREVAVFSCVTDFMPRDATSPQDFIKRAALPLADALEKAYP